MAVTKTAGSASIPRACAHEDGFTLIESIIAAVILLVAAVGVITTLSATANWYGQSSTRTQATALAEQVLSLVRARDYGSLNVDPAATGASFPTLIPSTMTTLTAAGSFTVTTTIDTVTVDATPTTQLPMKQITVTVDSIGRSMGAPVVATAYSSGASRSGSQFLVPIEIQCVVNSITNPSAPIDSAGTQVELVNADDPTNVITADTDSNNVAYFDGQSGHGPLVPETPDGYWLTVTPGQFVHAIDFPQRVYPAHGGTDSNPILALNMYSLSVSQPWSEVAQAYLSVGVFRGSSQTFNGTVPGLVVYASPNLADTTDSGGGSAWSYYYGYGAGSRYQDGSSIICSGTVNGYGVAMIKVPYVIDPGLGQSWTVWFHTRDSGGNLISYGPSTSSATGVWSDEPAFATAYTTLQPGDLSFQQVVGDAVNDPNPTQ